jgi:8-oxo-dGTP diphosphatase
MKIIFKLPTYVGIILKDNDKILLVQRHNTNWMSGYWNFPGGLLEENETLTTAAARETFEEVDVIVDPSDFVLAQVLHVRANDKNTQDILGLYFIAQSWKGMPINKEPHRHSDAQWFAINELPQHITEHALLAIDSIKTGRKYSENGWK